MKPISLSYEIAFSLKGEIIKSTRLIDFNLSKEKWLYVESCGSNNNLLPQTCAEAVEVFTQIKNR